MRAGWLLLLSCAALAGEAQEAVPQSSIAPAAPENAQPKCTVGGHVLNLQTGAPLSKATVELNQDQSREGPRTTETGSDGAFLFRDVPPGRYSLTAERQGFARQEYGARRIGGPGSPILLQAGQKPQDIEFKLVPQGVITGRVVDEDGEPLDDAQVMAMLYRWDFSARKRQLVPAGVSRSNDLGEYRVWGLSPGRYYIKAIKEEREPWRSIDASWSGEPDMSYSPVFYPGVSEAAQAMPVEIGAGMDLHGVDFRLVKTRTYRIRGKVLNAAGRPDSRGMVMLMPRAGGSGSWYEMQRGRVDPQGNFEFKRVRPGSYAVVALSAVSDNNRAQGRLSIDISDRSVVNVVMTLAPGFEISGRARLETGAQSDFRDSSIRLRADSGERFSGAYSQVREDGTFTLQNVMPARYHLGGTCGAGCYLKAAFLGNQEVRDFVLDFTQAGSGGSLEVIFSKAVGEVSGLVQDDDSNAAASTMVVLLPASSYRDIPERYFMTTTDQYGRFSIRNVRPGEYRAIALDGIERADIYDSEFMEHLEGKATPVSVGENGRESLQLKLVATGDRQQERSSP